MNGAEIRALISLLIKLGVAATEVYRLLRQHGVTDEQILAADGQNEIDVHERIAELRAGEP